MSSDLYEQFHEVLDQLEIRGCPKDTLGKLQDSNILKVDPKLVFVGVNPKKDLIKMTLEESISLSRGDYDTYPSWKKTYTHPIHEIWTALKFSVDEVLHVNLYPIATIDIKELKQNANLKELRNLFQEHIIDRIIVPSNPECIIFYGKENISVYETCKKRYSDLTFYHINHFACRANKRKELHDQIDNIISRNRSF